MGIMQVSLPDHVQELVDREIAEGRVANEGEFLVEAARRYAEELALENDIVSEAEAGIADARRFVTVATLSDAAALHQRTMARLQDRLAADQE